MEVLEYFNFGKSIKTWVGLFQKGSETCILQNGFCQNFLILVEDVDKGTPFHHTYLFYVPRFLVK